MTVSEIIEQRSFNVGVSTDPVSTDGYTKGDLHGYYKGTYLLWKNREPVYVRSLTTKTKWVVETLEQGLQEVKASELSRMSIPVGFYITDGKLCTYQYVLSRSYKKGLSPDFIKINVVPSGAGMSPYKERLLDLLYPLDSDDNATIIKRRLATQNGKLLTAYKTLSVGSYKNGESDTPFPCIQKRLEEYHA